MKQIKHIFITVTIVLLFCSAQVQQVIGQEAVSAENLLERVIVEVQQDNQDPERLLLLAETLLQYGVEQQQSPLYAQAVCKLFSNIIKGAPYINAYSCMTYIHRLSELLPCYFAESQKKVAHQTVGLFHADFYDHFKSTVNTLLYCTFSTEYESFKADPEKFLHTVAHNIATLTQEKLTIEKLRNTVIRFLELTLSKILWSPEDQLQTWYSVKQIADGLGSLFDAGILVDENDLDDLFWSLIHRYVYFLDVVGVLMPPMVYQIIQQDITEGTLRLLTMPEQDDFLISKATVLRKAIARVEQKIAQIEG